MSKPVFILFSFIRSTAWLSRGLRLAALRPAGLLLAAAFLAAAALAAEPAPSPLQQARATDQMLKQLTAPKPRTVTSLTTATQPRTAPVAKARPTSATLVLHRRTPPTPLTASKGLMPAVPLSALFSAAAMTVPMARPAVSDLRERLTIADPMPLVPTPGRIPAVNPAWLGPTVAAPPPDGFPAAVRINAADAAELRHALRVDGARARNIIQFRTLYGPFKTPEDLCQVSGISDAMVHEWDERDLLIFE